MQVQGYVPDPQSRSYCDQLTSSATSGEKWATITLFLHASVRRVCLREEGKPGEKRVALECIDGFVRRGMRTPGEENAKDNSRCGYELHDKDTDNLEG
jgi:hypothetical protein